MIKIAINGFGRIGRSVFRKIISEHKELKIVAINDLGDPQTLSHLLEYDSLYGMYKKRVGFTKDNLLVDGTKDGEQIRLFSESVPGKLPWKEIGVDVILECTGYFTDFESAGQHLKAGAKKVIISAPSKSDKVPTYLLGVNEKNYNPREDNIVSMGSCTTNCLAPIAKVLDEEFGILKGFMTTVHAYTNDQRILDLPHKDLRRARAAAVNIIPTTTGATKTVEKCLPKLKGKLDGLSLRVPVPVVSVVDFVVETEKESTVEEVNYVLKKASDRKDLKGILGVEDAPLVSSDYKGNSFSAIVDALSTMAIGNLIKVLAWYDNEWGYACRLAEFTEFVGKRL